MRDFLLDTIVIMFAVLMALGFIVLLIYLVYRILRNPFHYPYFIQEFDVSNKRNVDITDYIDRFLCYERNWYTLKIHILHIEQWKREQEDYIKTCRLKNLRTKQYRAILNDEYAFRFITVRGQTRYIQRNYVKSSYKVQVTDDVLSVSWWWLEKRHRLLDEIGFEATLKEYNSKNQRKLVTKALRKEIMERDNYTCQLCGKYMPDEVGLHIDHIIPVSKGGKSVSSNLRVLCSKCNGNKGAKYDEEI